MRRASALVLAAALGALAACGVKRAPRPPEPSPASQPAPVETATVSR